MKPVSAIALSLMIVWPAAAQDASQREKGGWYILISAEPSPCVETFVQTARLVSSHRRGGFKYINQDHFGEKHDPLVNPLVKERHGPFVDRNTAVGGLMGHWERSADGQHFTRLSKCS